MQVVANLIFLNILSVFAHGVPHGIRNETPIVSKCIELTKTTVPTNKTNKTNMNDKSVYFPIRLAQSMASSAIGAASVAAVNSKGDDEESLMAAGFSAALLSFGTHVVTQPIARMTTKVVKGTPFMEKRKSINPLEAGLDIAIPLAAISAMAFAEKKYIPKDVALMTGAVTASTALASVPIKYGTEAIMKAIRKRN